MEVDHGTRVTIELEARYQRGRGSVDEYLEQTAIANPHVTVHYTSIRTAMSWDRPRVTEHACHPSRARSSRTPTAWSWVMLVGMLKDTKAPTVSASF